MPPVPEQPAGRPAAMLVPKFFVKQRITLMVNRYEIRVADPDGTEGALMAIWSVRDRYEITVPDERLDFRVAAAMAVALDALQGR